MKYFHVSLKTYAENTTLWAEKRTSRDAVENAWVDAQFDSAPRNTKVCRGTGRFAFDSIDACLAYAAANKWSDAKYYEVEMGSDVVAAPWHLSTAAIRLRADKSKVLEVAIEYWQPTMSWVAWEYISTSMTVIADVTNTVPTDITEVMAHRAAINIQIGDDAATAKSRWP